MPFDTTIVRESVLDSIGLVPVPDYVLQAHKETYQREYLAKPNAYPGAQWREIPNGSFEAHGVPMWTWLAIPGLTGYEPGMAAPTEVKEIVGEAERRLTERGIESEKVLGTFYTDPHIKLRYTEDGQTKDVCLAIWDQGKVLHIATLRD